VVQRAQKPFVSQRAVAHLHASQEALSFPANLHGVIVDDSAPAFPKSAGQLQKLAAGFLAIHLYFSRRFRPAH